MITGLDTNETISYTLERDKENPTTWKIGTMSSYLFAKLSSSAKDNEVETAFKIVQLGIKGWENFGDIKFETEDIELYGKTYKAVPLSIIEKIPFNDLSELALKIMEINQVSVAEEKN